MKSSWFLLLTLLAIAVRPAPALCEEAGTAHLDDIVLQDLDGRDAALGEYKGRVVILSFFGEKCAPCKKEAAEFAKLKKKHGDSLVLLSVGIDVDDAGKLEKIARGYGITWSVLYDRGSWLANSLGVTGVPYTAVFDDRGVLAGTYEGLPEGQKLEKRIASLAGRRGVFVGEIKGAGGAVARIVKKAVRGKGLDLSEDRCSARFEVSGSYIRIGEVTSVELKAAEASGGGEYVCQAMKVAKKRAVSRVGAELAKCLAARLRDGK